MLHLTQETKQTSAAGKGKPAINPETSNFTN